MASTNKTQHYDLSQFVPLDKPAWLGDYNSDMQKIDAGIYAAQSKADRLETNVEAASAAATAAQQAAQSANEAAQQASDKAQDAETTASGVAATATQALTTAQQAENSVTELKTSVERNICKKYNNNSPEIKIVSENIQSVNGFEIIQKQNTTIIFGDIVIKPGATAGSTTNALQINDPDLISTHPSGGTSPLYTIRADGYPNPTNKDAFPILVGFTSSDGFVQIALTIDSGASYSRATRFTFLLVG